MFPRNVRRISPWKTAQVLTLFAENFGDNPFHGNQRAQDEFRRLLGLESLVREGSPYHPKSGGPRTYESQLGCLGLIYWHDGQISLTRAGQSLVSGTAPLPVLRTQLLRHQYPSNYGSRKQVRINPALKVKPFLFVLELLQRPEIKHLSCEELIIPVVYGHNHRCIDLCAEKITALRSGRRLTDLIDNPSQDLYTPKTDGQPVEKRLPDLLDIANTCKNYLQACALIGVENLDGREAFSITDEGISAFEQERPNSDVFIENPELEEPFQRAYGRWDAEKDTRRDGGRPATTDPEAVVISGLFLEECGTQPLAEIPEGFVERLERDYGFRREKILTVASRLLPRALDLFEATFLELANSGTAGALRFEQAICALFEKKLHFRSRSTGQLRRNRRGEGAYADVLAQALDGSHCALVDGKATSRYSLPSGDLHKMLGNYIPNYRDLLDGEESKLEFTSYVAGGFSGRVDESLRLIEERSGVPCSAITARDLLTLARKTPKAKDQPAIRRGLAQSKVVTSRDFDL